MTLQLPEELLSHTGRVLAVERPSQGLYYDVVILTAERGRFVLSGGREPVGCATGSG